MVKITGEQAASGILAAMLLIGFAPGASARICTACETAIRDKLTELDDRTSKTNLLIKTVDRKLDPLAVKVDGLDNKLTVLEEKIDAVGVQVQQIATSGAGKAAVVIEFGDGVRGPFDLRLGSYPDSQPKVTEYCKSIRYTDGKAHSYKDYQGSGIVAHQREARRLVCFM